MYSRELPSQPLICLKHSLPITVVNSNPQIGLCCLICLQQLYQEMDLDLQQFQQLLQELLKYKENIIFGLDKIIQIILEQKNSIMNSKIKVNSIIESYFDKEIAIKDIQEITNKQKQINKDVKDQTEKQLTSFLEKYLDVDQIFSALKRKKNNLNIFNVTWLENQL